MNEVISAITNKDKGFGMGEKEKVGKNTDQSVKAPPPGLEPGTYWLTASRSNQLS